MGMNRERSSDQYAEIDAVISYIHQHLYDDLSLAQLAKYACYSPYHFTRIFKVRTGLSPLYYVSSIRLQKAKDLLVNTNLTVRDISMEIGQQSLGTFTTRFTERVGLTPVQYRESKFVADQYLNRLQKLDHWPSPRPAVKKTSRIEGTVRSDMPFQGVEFIGLFPRPIPEGIPLYGTLLPSLGDFCFPDVKPGTYYLMATSLSWGTRVKDILLPHETLRYRSKEPLIVHQTSAVLDHQVTLHPPRLNEPPILISLPLLMQRLLSSAGKLGQ